MIDIDLPQFPGKAVLQATQINQTDLQNLLRRALRDGLRVARRGEFRLYSGRDVLTIAVCRELAALGITSLRQLKPIITGIAVECATRYLEQTGQATLGPSKRYIQIVSCPGGGFSYATILSPDLALRGLSIVIDCWKLSDTVMAELERVAA
jgi:hypothetical protein